MMDAATITEAHRAMVCRIVEESSIEALLDLVSDYAMAKAGMQNKRLTISQRRYRELGPALAEAISIAAKRGI
jgi:hypothetical protein